MAKHKRPTTLRIGAISSGTVRVEDLIPAFLDACDELHLTNNERTAVRTIRAAVSKGGDAYCGGEDAAWDLEILFRILDAHCPDFCYFGAAEGDGAAFGCWPLRR